MGLPRKQETHDKARGNLGRKCVLDSFSGSSPPPPGEGAATELAGERGKDTDATVGGGWLPWRRPLCSSHPSWEQTSPSPPPFPAGVAVTTPRQTGELPREAVVLREMIVQVSTTCCFSEPWGQRPGRSTMAFWG